MKKLLSEVEKHMKQTQKFSLEEFQKIKYGEWGQFVDFEEAREAHGQNIENCRKAADEYFKEDRPLRILVVHGSGRSSNKSCAYELSNSMLFLRQSIERIKKDYGDIEFDEVPLRDYNIDPCNACVSTTSALCGFPCTCFPFDPMQKLYPKVIRSDILLCSTPVNQSVMSTRLKAFCDRLVSIDGGFFITKEQFTVKDGEFKAKMMTISASTDFSYDQRMFGRVGAYFITSKDERNPYAKNMVNANPEEQWKDFGFISPVAHSLKEGFEQYGFFHADNYYAVCVGDPDIDYMYDKDTSQQEPEEVEEGYKVIKDAIELAKKLKKSTPKFKADRFNRT